MPAFSAPDTNTDPRTRRRPLWALDDMAREVVLGVCLSMDALRAMAGSVAGRARCEPVGDYALHMAVVARCSEANTLSLALQALLEQRFSATVADFALQVRDTGALVALWHGTAGSGHCAAALWATLTHPLCDAALRQRVLQDLVMLQYRALASVDAEITRADALAAENQVLVRELARIQQRQTDWHAERQAQRQQMQAEITRLRRVAAQTLEPGATTVLCVGARNAAIPIYRDLVERCGGRFAHHDGETGDTAHPLDADLAAADLVICQTGCLSHNAYWRVQDHCRRTGKRCVLVDSPADAEVGGPSSASAVRE